MCGFATYLLFSTSTCRYLMTTSEIVLEVPDILIPIMFRST
jgi:hypothetical protein